MENLWSVTQLAGQLLAFIFLWGCVLAAAALMFGVIAAAFSIAYWHISDKYEVTKKKEVT